MTPGRTALALAAGVTIAAVAPARAQVRQQIRDEGSPRRSGGPGWVATDGLRTQQWLTTGAGRLDLGIRIALPEVALGRLRVETFTWERLDVFSDDRTRSGDRPGTVYALLGTRYVVDGPRLSWYVGAHLFEWSGGQPRAASPWIGLRVGGQDGLSMRADARVPGMALLGATPESPLASADLSACLAAPRVRRWQAQLRGRWRDITGAGFHQRDASVALGVEVDRGTPRARRPMFIGLGVRRAGAVSGAGDAGPMDTGVVAPREDLAVLLQVEVNAGLPRPLMR